jgi:RNA polymerase sigma factor (sigma-70 family)
MDNHIHTKLINEDRNAQRHLYFEHCDRLMYIIRRYVSQVSDAEEVLQDTFLKIYENITSFDSDRGRFESWSAKIAINSALVFLRKKKRITLSLDDLKEFESKYENHHSDTFWTEDLQILIKQLTPKQALVFQLKAIDGYSYEEIQALLGLTNIANSRKLYSLARQSLQALFHSKGPVLLFIYIQKFFEL